jgi:hypothetical protein
MWKKCGEYNRIQESFVILGVHNYILDLDLEQVQIVSEPWCYNDIVINRVTLLKGRSEAEDKLLS